ncbi:MAG TPA: hypothetical protein VNH65_07965 [Candidatus Acidoferrum sp.]|nr:hypothetical protein [Candidatus Acidoferrum sp.]
MSENPSTKNEVVRTQRPSLESFQTVLARWLARFGEHYRQPTSDISIECYRELLSDLKPAQLDAACRRAMQTSEYMPTVATIRNAHRKLESIEETRSTFIRYPEVTDQDRKLSQEEEAQIAEIKKKIGVVANRRKTKTVMPPDSKEKTIYTPRSTSRPIEEQKAELRRRGLLK